MPERFRKRPVVVEAMQWDGTPEGATPIIDWVLAGGATARYSCPQVGSGRGCGDKPHTVAIDTLEGTMHADSGWWIIKGVQGEFYPVKDSIFHETYEAVNDASR